MKLRFWVFVLMVIAGTAIAAFWSGQYHGLRQARLDTHSFLQDFVHATGIEAYLQQQGRSEWIGRLKTYGLAGPSSHMRQHHSSSYLILAGLLCVAAGLVGLSFTIKAPPKDLNEKTTK